MPHDRKNKISCNNYECEIEVTLEVLSGKWKSLILWHLCQHKIIRFNEFRRLIPKITQKMLTQQLRNLEENELVNRTVYDETPPVVEYSLTDLGEQLVPILEKMDEWGKKYVNSHIPR